MIFYLFMNDYCLLWSHDIIVVDGNEAHRERITKVISNFESIEFLLFFFRL